MYVYTNITFIMLKSLFKTLKLASMLDSLVRVSRRVRWITDLLALVYTKYIDCIAQILQISGIHPISIHYTEKDCKR